MTVDRPPSQARQRNHYRWNVPGGTYFVTSVTRDRRHLFAEPENVDLLLRVLRHVKQSHLFGMLGYAVMPDHVHLLLRLGAETRIDRLLRAVKWTFTRDYKRLHAITGSITLWQQGYWDHLVRNERDLESCLAYIHHNPVKHGYCQDALAYPYTSLGEYTRRGWHDTPEQLRKLASDLNVAEFGDR